MIPEVSTLIAILSLGLAIASLVVSAARFRRHARECQGLRSEVDRLAVRFDQLVSSLAAVERVADSRATERIETDTVPARSKPAGDRNPEALPPTLIRVPNLVDCTPRDETGSDAESALELGRRFRGIWDLADTGLPPDTIARETGHPIGQVELILGLRRRTRGGPVAAETRDSQQDGSHRS
ncbi:MAG: hypothetical protein U0794_09735 [Isosphaeraceae bacterium]